MLLRVANEIVLTVSISRVIRCAPRTGTRTYRKTLPSEGQGTAWSFEFDEEIRIRLPRSATFNSELHLADRLARFVSISFSGPKEKRMSGVYTQFHVHVDLTTSTVVLERESRDTK